MPAGCPGNSGGGHYWVINNRTGEAACKYCPCRQKYDIDAMIYPDFKERPRDFTGDQRPMVLLPTLQFTVDVDMVDALKGLRTSLEEQLNTLQHQVQAYKEVSRKTSDHEIKNQATNVVKNMEASASVVSRQLKAVNIIVCGPQT